MHLWAVSLQSDRKCLGFLEASHNSPEKSYIEGLVSLAINPNKCRLHRPKASVANTAVYLPNWDTLKLHV